MTELVPVWWVGVALIIGALDGLGVSYLWWLGAALKHWAKVAKLERQNAKVLRDWEETEADRKRLIREFENMRADRDVWKGKAQAVQEAIDLLVFKLRCVLDGKPTPEEERLSEELEELRHEADQTWPEVDHYDEAFAENEGEVA